MNRKFTLILVLAINFLVILFFFHRLGVTRNIDGDEGLYLEAARLVAHGHRPYLDFFYQQMPILPYLYAGWMKLFGFTLASARWFSEFLTALTGLCLLAYVARSTGKLLLVNLCALLFFANGMILAWAPVVKTHPLNMLTLTASAILLLEWRRGRSNWWLFFSGLILGIGIGSRLTLGPFAVFYLAFIFLQAPGKRWGSIAAFVVGASLPTIPVLLLFFSDPALFWKYNLVYHTHVYPGVVGPERRLYTAQNLLHQYQFLLLLVAAQIGILFTLKNSAAKFLTSDEGFLAVMALLFVAIHMGSAEPYTQYFSALVPFLILLAVPFFEGVLSLPKPLIAAGLVVFFLFYWRGAKASRDFEIASMLSNRPEWSIKSLRNTAFRARSVVKPGEPCLTWWPGYAFMAGCSSVPGMENHMRNYAVQRLQGSEIEPYKMMTEERLLADIREGKYRVIIDGVYHIDSPYYHDIQEAIQENYWDVGEGVKVRAPAWFRASLGNN